MNKPLRNSYCLYENLWAGEYPGNLLAEKAENRIAGMVKFGITAFIDLTEAGELEPYEPFLPENMFYKRFPIKDVSVPHTNDFAVNIVDKLEFLLASSHKIYLHCWGGTGRTGTIGACFLIRKKNISGTAAIKLLRERFADNPKSKFRMTPDTMEQELFVRKFGKI